MGVSKRVLFVSKAVEPPWNDSSKNLVRDIAGHLARYSGTTMTAASGPGLPVYGGRAVLGGFSPALADNARVLKALLSDRAHGLWHFFFAPNPRSGVAGHVATRLRGRPSVHTVCSAPRDARSWRLSLFADRVVVLSAATERLLLGAGFPSARLRRIPPAIQPIEPLSGDAMRGARDVFSIPQEGALVVYPGDLEFGGGAELILQACQDRPVHLVMACRAKTAAAAQVGERLRERFPSTGLGPVSWVGETAQIHALLGCADVIAMPGRDLFAKMDYPLVVLEAMLMQRPVVVGQGTPAAELEEAGAFVSAPSPDGVWASVEAALSSSEAGRQQSREYVLKRFAPAAVAAEYEALYDELLR